MEILSKKLDNSVRHPFQYGYAYETPCSSPCRGQATGTTVPRPPPPDRQLKPTSGRATGAGQTQSGWQTSRRHVRAGGRRRMNAASTRPEEDLPCGFGGGSADGGGGGGGGCFRLRSGCGLGLDGGCGFGGGVGLGLGGGLDGRRGGGGGGGSGGGVVGGSFAGWHPWQHLQFPQPKPNWPMTPYGRQSCAYDSCQRGRCAAGLWAVDDGRGRVGGSR